MAGDSGQPRGIASLLERRKSQPQQVESRDIYDD